MPKFYTENNKGKQRQQYQSNMFLENGCLVKCDGRGCPFAIVVYLLE